MSAKHWKFLAVLIAGSVLALCGCSASLQVGHTAGASSPAAQQSQSATPQASAPDAEPATPAQPRVHTRTVTRVVPPPAPAPAPMSLRDVIETKTPLDPAPFMRGVHANAFFVAPSRNIACAIYADGGDSAECTIAHYQFDEPGPDCPDGAVVEVDGSGTPRFVSCAQAPLYTSGSAVLAYGTSVANGRFTCGSAETGISCMNADTGSGFTLSREAFTRY